MKFSQSVCLDEILYMIKMGHVHSKSRPPGQVIKDPVLVTKGVVI